MRVLNCGQGSDQWKAERTAIINGIRRRPASLAPAMMGVDSNISRSDLVRMWAIGEEREINDWVERVLFPRGHEVERAARALVEERLGEDMFPITGVDDSGIFLASLDGMNDSGDLTLEIKQWNQAKAAAVKAGKCPDCDYPQVIQGLMVSGAKWCLYVVTDGTPEKYVELYVNADPAFAEKLKRGWDQLEDDARNYTHPSADPVVIGVSPESLPALRIEVTGMVTASNLREFKAHAIAVFDGINTDLQTDADFANAEKAIKFCADIESRIDAAKQHALSQTASIDELFRTLDEIKNDLARNKRLTLEKLVKVRKDAIRVEIMNEGVKALADHYAKLASRIGVAKFPGAPVDFAGAIKGKRTIASLRDAVSTTLAHAKIAANELADRMDVNLKVLHGSEDASLFPDAETLATKEPADVLAIMQGRIARAKEEADRRAEEARERIRREEQAREEADRRAKAEAERRAEEDLAKVGEPPRGGVSQPQAAAEPDAADWRAELVDIRELCRAIADGKAPADLVRFEQAAGNRLATALKDSAEVPGVRFTREESMAVRS